MLTQREVQMNRIESLKVQLAEAEETLKTTTAVDPEIANLADALHSLLCHWNHTDGCSWGYEVHNGVIDWTGYAHRSYLEKAEEIVQHAPVETIIQVVRLIR